MAKLKKAYRTQYRRTFTPLGLELKEHVATLDRFVEKSPISVMVRASLERVLGADRALFHLSIRTYNGTTAISSGYYTVTLINKKGKARRVRGRFTHTLAKVDGRWLIVSQHTSALPGS